ncbi:hypothetical protein D5b_00156 [Faustovirus]|nr:hypothetical protein D5b_00156 [Faustovirus]AMN84755.1 hypothetical protein D6_00355 [Faustovirus]AMP44113.1 hypothetical protein PRJ_Dakar_00154 [Faustovirus]
MKNKSKHIKSRSKRAKSKRRSKRAKSKVRLPKPTSGALGDYTTKSPAKKRRASLQKQIREKDYATVIRELNLRATLGKNNAPDASEKMRSDMRYLKNINK